MVQITHLSRGQRVLRLLPLTLPWLLVAWVRLGWLGLLFVAVGSPILFGAVLVWLHFKKASGNLSYDEHGNIKVHPGAMVALGVGVSVICFVILEIVRPG